MCGNSAGRGFAGDAGIVVVSWFGISGFGSLEETVDCGGYGDGAGLVEHESYETHAATVSHSAHARWIYVD